MVNSKTIKIPVIGAPITAAPTAAIPLIERTVTIPENPNTDKRFPLIAPADAPMKSAGENIPPKRPNPMHAEVAIIFAMKRTTKESRTKLPLCISETVLVPKPKISGIKIPIDPQKTAAIKRFVEGE